MRKLYSIIAIILSSAAFTQCTNVQIFPTSVVVNTNLTVNVPNGGTYWVCSGVTATFTGMGYLINAEPNVNLSLNGNNGITYVDEGSNVIINGSLNAVFHDPAATVTDNGTNSTVLMCPGPLTYDYSNTPVGGCPVGIDENGNSWYVNLYFDPFSDMVRIESEGAEIKGLTVFGADGRLLPMEISNPLSIDMSGYPLGTYYFKVESDKGSTTKRLLIM